MTSPYKIYCLGNVLIDKGYNYWNSQDNSNKKAANIRANTTKIF